MMLEHRQIQERLDYYLDGELPEAERFAVEEHLGRCDACLEEFEALREIRDQAAALPREIAPPHDLWPAIATRIQAPSAPAEVKVIEVDFTPRRTLAIHAWLLRVAAAIALVVVSSGVTALLLRGPGATDVATLPAEQVQPEPRPTTTLAAFAPAASEYRTTVEALTAELQARRDRLSPETIATVEANLRIIDKAIAEATAALASDPANTDIPLLLSDVYEEKVELLQEAVRLASRT